MSKASSAAGDVGSKSALRYDRSLIALDEYANIVDTTDKEEHEELVEFSHSAAAKAEALEVL
jgi:hypothetical protein